MDTEKSLDRLSQIAPLPRPRDGHEEPDTEGRAGGGLLEHALGTVLKDSDYPLYYHRFKASKSCQVLPRPSALMSHRSARHV